MQELMTMMVEDLKDRLTAPSLSSSSTTDKQSQGEQTEVEAFDMSQANSSMFIATKILGLKVGNTYTIKDQPSSRVWLLQEMTDKGVALIHVPLLEPTKKLTMKFKDDEIVDNLKVTKTKLPSVMTLKTLDALIPSNSEVYNLEIHKAEVYLALTNAYNQWDLEAQDIILQTTPNHAAYANHEMKKGFVQLVPYPERLSNIVMKEPAGKHGVVNYQGQTFYITGPKSYKIDDDTGVVEGIWSPYWCCCKDDCEGSLQLKMKQYHTDNGTCEIQILTNAESISKHQQLMLKSDESSAKKRKTK